jgi:sigma-B regulation protein RsbU (phosphoserine phosphatase)
MVDEDEFDLRLTQESAEDLYEQAPCGYCSCLPDGTLVKLNQTLLTWLQYAREELVASRSLQQLLTPGGARHFELHGIPQLLLQGYVRELSYQLRHKDGTTRPVLLSADLVRDRDGSPLVARVMLFDITERRQYERELLRANEALSQNNELLTRTTANLDTFIYTASHDLRAPINHIEGLLKLLVRQLPAEVLQTRMVEQILTLMNTSVDRFATTIHQLTDITRLQELQIIPVEEVDLAALFDDICLDLAPQITASAAQLTLAVDHCPRLRFARQHLRSILYNLLSNAIKYCRPNHVPLIQVRCYPAGALAVLQVQDNGLGLSTAQQAQLFGRFQRLHDHVEGTGIGLYTIKRIVEDAGGTITVHSQPNVGSTFTVRLPIEIVFPGR